MNFEQLRKTHPRFIYESFNYTLAGKKLKISFNFILEPGIRFKPEIVFPNVSSDIEGLENLVFNLGLVELLSYWKATCSPEVIIKAGNLNEEQINWWKKLLIKGLGEFFYTNRIDFTDPGLVSLKVRSHIPSGKPFNQYLQDRDLILVGGGKDSAVTLETIGRSEREFNCLLLNPTQAAIYISKAGFCKNPIIIKRVIDPKMLDLNKKGYLNGHTPFSAYLAFLATVAAHLYNYKNIVVSNEKSSDEINTLWNGHQINHQYSKTSEFEKDFQDYSQKYLAPINYYSFIRQFGELEISEMFSKMEKYHRLFRSCNKGSKTNSWCGKCPKCVSTYLTLYPYLGDKTEEIFGKNLLNDESLTPIVKGLLRENDVVKPFECVATVAEIKTAIKMAKEKAEKEGLAVPNILKSL